MSGDLSGKMRAQLVLAYAFGIIGVLSSAYVYWDEQKNISNLQFKIRNIREYPKNIIVDSITIPEGDKKDKIQISSSGIVIEGDKNETILEGAGLLTRSYDEKLWSRFSLNNISMSNISENLFFHVDPYGLYFSNTEKENKSSAGISLLKISGKNSFGVYSKYENSDYRDANSVYITPKTLQINDELGAERMSLGVASLKNTVTGSTETTSPSTIILFDKDGKVLYRLPAY